MEAFGVFALPTFIILFAMAIFWDRWRYSDPSKPITDGRLDEPYRVYNSDFDLTLSPQDIPSKLYEDSLDVARGWTDRHGEGWDRAEAVATRLATDDVDRDGLISRVRRALPHSIDGNDVPRQIITFLVDQSGSMRGEPIAAVREALSLAVDVFSAAGAQTEILGFSTVGWHGGRAFQHWLHAGQTRRPGRLCSLLHIIYKSADEAVWSSASKHAMLHPDILRENIDGEALRWAANRMAAHSAASKLLIVVSDGAPVDDATLLHNGASYLERDLLRVIADIESGDDIRLAAIGVGFDVDRYYRQSSRCAVEDLGHGLLECAIAFLA